MRKLTAYNFLTLNGFYKGPGNDTSWHKHGAEEAEFSSDSLKSGNILLFGRVTYELMASYWPTSFALESYPMVAEGMNSAEKIVFSNTLKKADWANTQVISGDIVTQIKKIKETPGNNLTILGSGSIITQFADAGLIDGYEIMIDPVALGDGTPIFKGLEHPLDLKLTRVREFKSGVVLLSYELK